MDLLEAVFTQSDRVAECGENIQQQLEAAARGTADATSLSLLARERAQHGKCWRALDVDSALVLAVRLLEEDNTDEAIRMLDSAILRSGTAGREELLSQFFQKCPDCPCPEFPSLFLFECPSMDLVSPLASVSSPSLEHFQRNLDSPLLMSGTLCEWPALDSWQRPQQLLKKTLGGRRLVPVEIGIDYTHPQWTQQWMPFARFLAECILKQPPVPAYLAQHDIFAQIPELRSDIRVPDYCFADSSFEWPRVNLWFGSVGAKSPLHHDQHRTLLCHILGFKYFRLYPPSTPNLCPRGTEDGIDMSNTSHIDVLRIDEFPAAASTPFVEGILRPGDALFIPHRWWHYLHNLSPGLSVSFWF